MFGSKKDMFDTEIDIFSIKRKTFSSPRKLFSRPSDIFFSSRDLLSSPRHLFSSPRDMFGISTKSREADWALGGAALGLLAAIIEMMAGTASRVAEVIMMMMTFIMMACTAALISEMAEIVPVKVSLFLHLCSFPLSWSCYCSCSSHCLKILSLSCLFPMFSYRTNYRIIPFLVTNVIN